jgi:hypothetical protein
MRTSTKIRVGVTLAGVVLALAMAVNATLADAATAPGKEIETANFGWEVNKTTKGNTCTIEPASECQPGAPSGQPGGFRGSESVAVAPNGHVYIAERGNHRVQELEADGKFILMFGKNVNKKGGDLCTAAEEKECQTGQEGTAPGEFGEDGPKSIAVDPTSGEVYITESVNEVIGELRRRVQEFTPTGVFVLEIGREVNETKTAAIKSKGGTPTQEQAAEENLCTAEEVKSGGVKCTLPAQSSQAEPEPGAFNFVLSDGGNILAVGGPGDLLYVGDEHRVQEFEATAGPSDGHYKGEISLTSISAGTGALVSNLAVDQATGDVYLVYGGGGFEGSRLIREFDGTGKTIGEFPLSRVVAALAVDPAGRIAISEDEEGLQGVPSRGSLYGVIGGALRLVTHFPAHGAQSMAFSGTGGLFAVFGSTRGSNPQRDELISYTPQEVAELIAGKTACAPGPEHETDVTFDCTLSGEVDPYGVSETTAWFDWGRTEAFGGETVKQSLSGSSLVGVSAMIGGVPPNETVYDQLAGEDHFVKAPEEPLTSATVERVVTGTAPPRIVGEPLAAFASPTTVVLFGAVNSENASTTFEFQYAPEADCEAGVLASGGDLPEACSEVQQTAGAVSSEYGQLGAIQEASGLRPGTRYRYRLYARNAKGEGAVGEAGGPGIPEGTFETAAAPLLSATTGDASAVTATSALVTGSVNPDGQPSLFTFELGVYEGSNTRYATVFSASAGASATPVAEQLLLTGLQPGTTYAYRITVHFADGSIPGSQATGESRMFTTLGLPEVLSSPMPLAFLGDPPIQFPKTAVVHVKNKKKSTKKKGNKHREKGNKHRVKHRGKAGRHGNKIVSKPPGPRGGR